jgi:hypothetical protein
MKLPTTLLFTLRADSKANQVKNTPRRRFAQTIDRKLTGTSEMHIQSSIHLTNVVLNFL